MFIILRIIIGLIFLISGGEKLFSPYQNFLYVIQAYQALPGWMEQAVARIFPWIELFTGLFMVLGLWTTRAAQVAMVMFAAFITIVGQGLLRGLPIDQCGCFGELIHIPPVIIIVLDSMMLMLTIYLLLHSDKMNRFSLDRSFIK